WIRRRHGWAGRKARRAGAEAGGDSGQGELEAKEAALKYDALRGWEKNDALSVAAARSARREVEWAPARAKRGALRPLRGREEPVRLRPGTLRVSAYAQGVVLVVSGVVLFHLSGRGALPQRERPVHRHSLRLPLRRRDQHRRA